MRRRRHAFASPTPRSGAYRPRSSQLAADRARSATIRPVPISYEVLEGGRLVHARATGALTHEDSVSYQRACLEDERVLPGFRELLDSRAVTEVKITEDTIAALAAARMSSAKAKNLKTAVVAMDDVAFKLQHLFPPRAGTVIVFSRLRPAYLWLGVEPPEDAT